MAIFRPSLDFEVGRPSGETCLLDSLKALPDEYRVYHSLHYYAASGRDAPGREAPAREGEIDVAILHPEKGLLVLEVKGGGISYDGQERRWTSVDRDGRRNSIQDPFIQAERNHHNLEREICRKQKIWSEKELPCVHGHGVVFSECVYAPTKEPINAPRELVIDSKDVTAGVEAALDRLFCYWAHGRSSRPLTKQEVKKLGQDILAPHFELAISFSDRVTRAEPSLVRLREEQLLCLDFLALNLRARVEGGAGTGKTLIAVEHAMRLAAEGARCLLLCFNRPLAGWLRGACKTEGGSSAPSIWAGSFHQLCRERAEAANLQWAEPEAEHGPEAENFWNIEAPLLLGKATEILKERFDALIVDESQDFSPEWWPLLLALLVEPQSSRFVAFLDAGQDVWGRNTILPESLPIFPLQQNDRHTRSIASWLSATAGVTYRYPIDTPMGDEPTVTHYEDQSQQRGLVEGKVGWLLASGISASRIAILGTHRLSESFLRDKPELCGTKVVSVGNDGQKEPGTIAYASARRFKGLEADFVLLCDLDGSGYSTPKDIYVAASRAKQGLYLFVAKAFDLGATMKEAAR